QRACEIYAASLVDQRLFPSSRRGVPLMEEDIGGIGGRPQGYAPTGISTQEDGDMPERVPAERFLSPVPLNEVKDWTWAADLSTGQACLVPAPLVYPVLRGLSPWGDAGLGIKSGTSWAEAVGRALLSV